MTEQNAKNSATVRECWGTAAPEWIVALAEACDKTGQTALAKRLGYSSPVINAALHNAYSGRMDILEQKIRGELMNQRHNCPVLGEITKRRCIDEQSHKHAATNRVRIDLRHACPRCPHHIERT